ncbi:signal peptidase II [Pediococcus pentosaceus]|jgi:signal peptidase II|uniref:Lipoprotein signal peptidase n=3 Tax=Pediococcus pentosaceus TaxID=1255 RepID=A0A0R2H8K0_PEDPE|nr:MULTISPECIES: signal peptidase II [Pediococcus]ABJ67997.1 signal peptidase II, Aspartic peptidase, MEROPS family A08 [Pediococcus pentosaceus ATCC 25745]ARW19787.1 Signal peptidase II [Pediococcus pentosaceus]AXR43461.1 signal peptidase II [Pediococcus pentosaceus]KAF0395800.1 signal peptidase II [Pediococcus pentosaceus]KAF0422305.1 signal peptidase II [Pediococcus pentosaceus]
MKWFSYIVGLLLLVIDQLVKSAVSNQIALGTVKSFIPGVLSLTNLRNDGAAWSILSGNQIFFYLITVVALVVLIYLLVTQRQHLLYQWGLTLMITGTLGNFIDRIRLKYVVDMFQIDFFNFPIFNIADMCLTFGVIILFIAIIRDERIEG